MAFQQRFDLIDIALVYFPLIGYQLYVQFKSEHSEQPSIVAVPPPSPTAVPLRP